MMVARRILMSFSLLLMTGLFIEVYLYHPAAITARDPWAAVPIFWAALTMPVGSFALFRPAALVFRIFATLCAVGVLVGIVGLAFHLDMHGGAGIAGFLSAPTWLGDPPTLAPLEFTVASFFGLLAAMLGAGTERASSTPAQGFRIIVGAASAVAFVAALTAGFGGARSALAFWLIFGLLSLALVCLIADVVEILATRVRRRELGLGERQSS
jgi:hypothetical protein